MNAGTLPPAEAADLLRQSARGLEGAAVQVGSGRPVSVRLGWQRAARAVTEVAELLPAPVPPLAEAPRFAIAQTPDGRASWAYCPAVPSGSLPDPSPWALVQCASGHPAGGGEGEHWWSTAELEGFGAAVTHVPAALAAEAAP